MGLKAVSLMIRLGWFWRGECKCDAD